MREPYQILSIPYKIIDGEIVFCIFKRDNGNYRQFIAGGGENGETPLEAAERETTEEIVIEPKNIEQLTCIAYVLAEVIAESLRQYWDKNTVVIPEYSFAFECDSESTLSHEHTECVWYTTIAETFSFRTA